MESHPARVREGGVVSCKDLSLIRCQSQLTYIGYMFQILSRYAGCLSAEDPNGPL